MKSPRALRNAWLRLSTPWRPLPSFVIIGGQKCGTTALYKLLSEHPDMHAAARKELHYFDLNYERGLGWYKTQFPILPRAAAPDRKPITGEASPYYLFHPHAAKRLQQLLPDRRLIVLVRNPVDRAYSHYCQEVRKKFETLSFEEAIAAEPERLKPEIERMNQDEHYQSFAHKRHSYLSRSRYAEQLEQWFKLFPREQFLILSNEEMSANTQAVYDQVLQFIGLSPWKLEGEQRHYEGRYPPMSPATRVQLQNYFAPHNQRLYQLIGRDLGW